MDVTTVYPFIVERHLGSFQFWGSYDKAVGGLHALTFVNHFVPLVYVSVPFTNATLS